jgi:hypothetical protein
MRFLLRLLCLLLPVSRYSAPTASTPAPEPQAPDFIDPDPLRQMESELHFTNTAYPHVIRHFNRCYSLPPADPQDRVRTD